MIIDSGKDEFKLVMLLISSQRRTLISLLCTVYQYLPVLPPVD